MGCNPTIPVGHITPDAAMIVGVEVTRLVLK